jgi:predicted  nucleic acid-binding Zn-ribbon protein
MSIRRADQRSAPFAPARGLDAVLRVGAAAAKAKEDEKEWAAFFKNADEKLYAKSDEKAELNKAITKLKSDEKAELNKAITKLRLALQRSRDENKGEVTVLQQALSECVRRRAELEMKLNGRRSYVPYAEEEEELDRKFGKPK